VTGNGGELDVESDPAERLGVVGLAGEFDAANVARAAEEIDRHLAAGRCRLLLDVHLLTFLDSSGLTFLLRARRRALDAGGDVVLARPSSWVRNVLATLGLDRQLHVVSSVDEAVRHLTADPAPPPPDAVLYALDPPLGEDRYVGRLTILGEHGVVIRWDGTAPAPAPSLTWTNFDAEVRPGRRIRVEFRLSGSRDTRPIRLHGTVSAATRAGRGDGGSEATIHVRFVVDPPTLGDHRRLVRWLRRDGGADALGAGVPRTPRPRRSPPGAAPPPSD